ncbi:MAG: response regulator, partial [Gammaproteobacteria bacterium]|nr:response regulator [Gammaproteobacteria bacterium]
MSSRPRILLVDDDLDLLKLLSIRLNAAGWDVATADNAERGLLQLDKHQPHVVITDLRMDGMDGMALFAAIHEHHPTLPVIILTAHGTIPEAVEATKRGVFTFLTKPFDSKELLSCVDKAYRINAVPAEEGAADGAQAWREDIISHSAAMEEVLSQAYRVAASNIGILIQGESGSGKELLAQAIRRAGARREKPFLAVNC